MDTTKTVSKINLAEHISFKGRLWFDDCCEGGDLIGIGIFDFDNRNYY